MSLLSQVIDRAVRFCSHKDLPKNKRYVNIFSCILLYINQINKLLIIIYGILLNKKNNIIEDFEKVIKEASVDCKLNYNGNVYKKK